MDYLLVKFVHVLLGIVALGSSAGLGILMELFGQHPTHGPFVLRAVRRIEHLVVLPGLVLMLATGVWLVSLEWSWSVAWIQAALALWVLAAVGLVATLVVLRHQIAAAERDGTESPRARQLAMASRIVGGAAGLVVVVIVYLMVIKPGLAWWPGG